MIKIDLLIYISLRKEQDWMGNDAHAKIYIEIISSAVDGGDYGKNASVIYSQLRLNYCWQWMHSSPDWGSFCPVLQCTVRLSWFFNGWTVRLSWLFDGWTYFVKKAMSQRTIVNSISENSNDLSATMKNDMPECDGLCLWIKNRMTDIAHSYLFLKVWSSLFKYDKWFYKIIMRCV